MRDSTGMEICKIPWTSKIIWHDPFFQPLPDWRGSSRKKRHGYVANVRLICYKIMISWSLNYTHKHHNQNNPLSNLTFTSLHLSRLFDTEPLYFIFRNLVKLRNCNCTTQYILYLIEWLFSPVSAKELPSFSVLSQLKSKGLYHIKMSIRFPQHMRWYQGPTWLFSWVLSLSQVDWQKGLYWGVWNCL